MQAATRSTPATFAVTMVMWALGQQRVLSAGNVGAGGLDGDVLLAQEDAGNGFNFEVGQGFELLPCHDADLLLDELDVLDDLVRNAGHDLVQLLRAEQERFGSVLVELLRVFTNGFVAAFADVCDHGFYGCAHFGGAAAGHTVRAGSFSSAESTAELIAVVTVIRFTFHLR